MSTTFSAMPSIDVTNDPCDLRIKGVTKRYEGFTLDGVSLDVPRGSVVGLIGQNGAGKTTLMKAVLGTIHMNGGTVELFGRDLASLTDAELIALRGRVGFVSAVTAFPGVMTVSEIARMYRMAFPAFDQAAYESLATRIGLLPQNAGKKVKDLSRGMGMKLQLVCTLASGADLVIMDEPTAGLDPIVREEVLDVLREWMEGDGRSILISSHITSDLEHLADTVVLIDDGAVLVDCTADEIAEMGVAHLRATELEQLLSDGGYAPGTLHVLKRDLSYAALIPDRHAFAEAYPEFAVDPAGIDDIMTLLVKGEVR